MADDEFQHREATVNGLRTHYVEIGDGPLIVLLHGFPEFWYAWREVAPSLANRGFRVVAPDLRGYNENERPTGLAAYRIRCLTGDIAALVRHLGETDAVIAGHDWGGIVAWYLAMHRPDVVRRLAVMNTVHPASYLRELRRWPQARRSWYGLFFRLPRLPEALLLARDCGVLDRLYRRDCTRPEAFDDADLAAHKRALARPGAATAAINYYRALFESEGKRQILAYSKIDVETLLLWGMNDRYLVPGVAEGLEPWVPNLRMRRFAEGTHWIHYEYPDDVSREIAQFAAE